MIVSNDPSFVSGRTQALFDLLAAAGTDPAPLTALVSSAYADGGNHVLNQFEQRVGTPSASD